MKKVLSIMFVLLMVMTSFACFGVSANGAEYKTGDIIEFGSYPQSEVKDETLISALNSQNGTWISYNYYSGSSDYSMYGGTMVSSDYMRYKDVVFNGVKYRAVTFDNYRPDSTEYASSVNTTHQDDNSYTTGNIYWFKYESLKWRVLDKKTGLVMCTTIIDSQPYNNYIIFSSRHSFLFWISFNDIFFSSQLKLQANTTEFI